jgi:hypothetical protein
MCGWCVRANIYNPNATMPTQWGLADPMCSDAFSNFEKSIPKCDPAYREDYARIYTVMMDVPLVRLWLTELDKAISSKPHDVTPETNWLRFSSVLSHFEKKCWFPEDILLPLGVLKPDAFYFYIRRGYVLKDYGAGVKHGEFTHRLQWHVLMRVITENFTRPIGRGWDHSPLELYVSLGMTQNQGVWGMLLDLPKDGDFNHPDSFHQWVLNSGLGNIVAAVSKRETKRRDMFARAIYEYIRRRTRGVVIPKEFYTSSRPYQSHEAFKEFERWFVNDVLRAGLKDEKKVEEIFNEKLTAKADAAYLKKKTTQASSKGGRKQVYQMPAMAMGPVYSFSTTSLITEQMADARAKNSSAKLYV